MTDGYGSELVTNGDFTSDSDWVKGTGWSIADGVASSDGSQSSSSALQAVDILTIGTTYEVTFTVVSRAAGSITARLGTNGVGTTRTATGTYRELITCAGTDDVRMTASNNFVGSIDNVSVREMPVIKWAPHNLVTYSEDLNDSAWIKSGIAVTTNATVAPDGAQTADLIQSNDDGYRDHVRQSVTLNNSTVAIFAKAKEYSWIFLGATNGSGIWSMTSFDLQNGAVGTNYGISSSAPSNPTITSVGNGWFLITTDLPSNATDVIAVQPADSDSTPWSTTFGTSGGIYIWGAHLYRSDLGGMVDNPETGDSYVPTTSSAAYLPRRNHHVYNGDAWVNEGVLHESEARTNLFTSSNSLATATNITATLNNIVSPDGKINGTLLSNQGGNWHYYHSPISLIQNTQYTLSCYAKYKAGSGFVWLLCEVSSDAFVMFDILDGVAVNLGTGSQQADSSSIEDAGNGWFRISATFTKTSAGALDSIGIGVSPTSTQPNWDATGLEDTEQAYVYGFQTEAGSTPSSLIPTSGSSVTRAAETLTIPAANMPWPEPNVIGSELVTNGTFDTDSDWS